MDEGTLNDLLECSVCLERLDTSSRALPCQHTFCRKCLLEIYHKHKELRCPECRTLVNVKIDELPPNVLLMRLLEGMKNSGLTTVPKTGQRSNRALPQQHAGTVQSSPQINEQRHGERTNNKHSVGHLVQHHAKALYDYVPKEAGELGFKRGDIIVLKRKIDVHWFQGECGGKQGLVPLSFVQIITPVPSHVPRCKALYDFRMNNDEEEGCLAFNKGDIINVIRRVDENWAEGKLDGRIGIFPLAFVELNSLARSLMKLSTNMQPGPSKVAPPTPTTEETTPLIPTDHSTVLTHNVSHQLSDSSVNNTSSSSSSTPNVTSSSNTSSGSSTAPSSPASPPSSSQPGGIGLRPNSRKKVQQHQEQQQQQQHSSQGRSSHHHHSHHSKEKRHSLTNVTVVHPNSVHRHSAEFSTSQMPRPADQAEGINRHSVPSSDLQLPASFMALYPYKPQKPDELELKKGGLYIVTEICQDGWFKGTSNRTQKCGVFPGNYVAPARQFPTGGPVGAATLVSSARSGSSRLPVSCRSHTADLPPPELPPRASTPPPIRLECVARSNNHTNVPAKSDKSKERKEKTTVSLMRRLASIKRSISPPPSSYSMDNPVFEDATATSSVSGLTQPIHVRSGSCPSQLLQMQPVAVEQHHRLFGSASHRVKHKERPSILNHGYRPVETSQGGSSGSSPDVHRHRKSNSLDATGQKSAKHNAAQTVRERFRCIAPYPPNSEYELELQLNDIIYVHKKREDGWYKGTQQRTGKTGLFPASFVESF